MFDPIKNSLNKTKTLIPSVAQALREITTPIQAVAPTINSSFNSIGLQRIPVSANSSSAISKVVQQAMYQNNSNVKISTVNINGATIQTKRLQSVI
jgi:hypothetical protein